MFNKGDIVECLVDTKLYTTVERKESKYTIKKGDIALVKLTYGNSFIALADIKTEKYFVSACTNELNNFKLYETDYKKLYEESKTKNIVCERYMKSENEMYERYIDELNKYIKTVDFKKLHLSVNSITKNDYAKEVLKSMTKLFESIYGKEPLTSDTFSFVEVPAVIYSRKTHQLHLGLVMLDVESSGEYWGSTFFTPFGIIEATIWFIVVKEALGHTYDNACDTSCNACGLVRTITHTYDNTCDTVCNVCEDVRTITHTYDNNCDANCNECEEVRVPSDHVYDNKCDTTLMVFRSNYFADIKNFGEYTAEVKLYVGISAKITVLVEE